jgi:hypothetical protein
MPAPKRVPEESSLPEAIAPQNQVKMIVIGSDGRAPQIAEWAAGVAQNAVQPSGFNARMAIRIAEPAAVAGDLNAIVPPPYPTVIVLKRDNSISGEETDDGDNIDEALLELMYLKAEA